jgi:hypothetical protein
VSVNEPNPAVSVASGDAADAVATSAGMGSAVLTGLAWKVATVLVSDVTRIGVAVVLARLLTPTDYGVAGMAFIFSGLATIFSDLALGGALVQRREISEDDRSTVFWAALAFSFVVAGICIALSPFVAEFFGRKEVEKPQRGSAPGPSSPTLSSPRPCPPCWSGGSRPGALGSSSPSSGCAI